MYIEPNNAGKNIWLRAQTASQKLKQNAQTQDADGMQDFFYVINDTVTGLISTIILIKGDSEPQDPTFPLGLRPRDMPHFKTKTVRNLLSLAPCEVFLNNFTLYLYLISTSCPR